MKDDIYPIKTNSGSLLKFEFHSKGPNGIIRKQVVFKAFENNSNIFNLGFGDVGLNGEISDSAISNNNDAKIILTTIGRIIYEFYKKRPNAWVFAKGITESRTRLYRMAVTTKLEEIEIDFYIFGLINNSWDPFQKGRPYEAFLIKKKR